MKIINEKLNDISKRKTFKKYDIKFINDVNKNMKEKNQKQGVGSYTTIFKFKKNNFQLLENEKEKDLNISNSNIINNIKNKKEKLNIYNYGIKLIDFGCSKIFTRIKKKF
jgi:hypothetical protein